MPLAAFTYVHDIANPLSNVPQTIVLDTGIVTKRRHWKLKSVQMLGVILDTAASAEARDLLPTTLKLIPTWLTDHNHILSSTDKTQRASGFDAALSFVGNIVDVGETGGSLFTASITQNPNLNFGFVTVNSRTLSLQWQALSTGDGLAGGAAPQINMGGVSSLQVVFEYNDI